MKTTRVVALLCAVAMLALPATAMAAPTAISDDLRPMAADTYLDVSFKVHSAIQINTLDLADQPITKLEYNCMNPVNNTKASVDFKCLIKSNTPFWKRISWDAGLNNNEMFDSFRVGPDGRPLKDPVTGEYLYEQINLVDSIPASQIGVYVSDDNAFTEAEKATSPFVSGIINNADHTDTEFVRYEVDLGTQPWCNTAGYYKGKLFIEAYQN